LRKKNCAKLFSFHEQKFAKNTTGFAQIAQKKVRKTAQNSLRFMRKNSAKVRKKNLRENCANFAQKILSFRGNPTNYTQEAVTCQQNRENCRQ